MSIICLICNIECKSMKALKTHLTKKHNISFKFYYDNNLKVDNMDGICKLCKTNETYFISSSGKYKPLCEKCGKSRSIHALKILYGEEEGTRRYNEICAGCSRDLAFFTNKYGEEEGTRRYNEWVNKTKNNKQNFIKRHGEEEGLKKYDEYCLSKSLSKEKFIYKHGEEEGTRRYNEWSKSHLTLEEYISKHGEEEGTRRYNEWVNSAKNSKENFIIRYGEEEGLKKYNEYCNKVGCGLNNLIRIYGEEEGTRRYKEVCSNKKGIGSLKYCINRYGKEEGASFYNRWSKSSVPTLDNMIRIYGKEEGTRRHTIFREKSKQNLHNFIDRYGEDEGIKRYNLFCERSSGNTRSVSKESLKLFYELIDWLFEENIADFKDIKCGIPESSELCITYNNRKNRFMFDFTLFDKLIIEYNGNGSHVRDTWSIDKKEQWRHVWDKECDYIKALERDAFKNNIAINAGYKILTVWAEDKFEENLKLCKKFILEEMIDEETGEVIL